MNSSNILFFFEDVDFSFRNRNLTREWLQQIAKKEKKRIIALNYIFCTDEYLLSINQQHLHHNTYTDIITFGYSAKNSKDISGDIFVSIERVRENAHTFSTSFQDELRRVMAHGLLHLCGYKDKTTLDKATMTKKEDTSIALFHKLNK